MSDINAYGDRLVSTTGSHGADIASQRIDDLDRACLAHVVDSKPALVADIGCGAGVQGFRMALLGARVRLFDIMGIEARVAAFRALFPQCDIAFLKGDVRKTVHFADDQVDLAYSQRTIHYLPYADAVALCIQLGKRMKPGARFYLSASGIGSELGEGYGGAQSPLADRFHPLAASMATKHEIIELVCLYSEDDMHELALSSGFKPLMVWSSEFGNIKAVMEKA